MKFSQLAFIVTDDCNFRCTYCPQIKEEIYMKHSTIEKAINFFYPFLEDEVYIAFYGGEPLLAFDAVKYTVALLQAKNRERNKKLGFTLTTNGSLITEEMLQFFDHHRFDIMLSFDGLAQGIGRQPGSLVPTRELMERIHMEAYPGIKFSINSVFAPATVNHLPASLQYIVESGGTELNLSFAEDTPWDDTALMVLEQSLAKLSDFLIINYKEKGTIPVRDFRSTETGLPAKDKKIFSCAAGSQRIAITPEENIWGCSAFHDYLKSREDSSDFQQYWFGKLDDFIKRHDTIYPRVLSNYATLSQNFFFTEEQHCFLCDEVDSCRICPANAAYATSSVGKISPWVCRLNKLQKKERERFREEISTHNKK